MTDEQVRDEIKRFIEQALGEEHVMLFMKGTPDQPRCGFSARVVAMLDALDVEYGALDILPDPRIRQELSDLSGWPTIPQLFIDGQLVGGCDIVTEMYESGELAQALGAEQPKGEPAARQAPPSGPLPLQIRDD